MSTWKSSTTGDALTTLLAQVRRRRRESRNPGDGSKLSGPAGETETPTIYFVHGQSAAVPSS